MATISRTSAPVATTAVICSHCALPVPAGLIAADRETQFCCNACESAYSLIHEYGLDDYYAFAERKLGPANASGRSYDEFDHDAFKALYIRGRADGLAETDLYLEGVHCASCIWLVERVPLAIPGVARAELDIGRSLAHVEWDPNKTSLSAIARFIDMLGYPAHPFRGVKAEQMRKKEEREALTRIGIAGAIAGNVMMLAIAIYAGWFGSIEHEFEKYFRWWSFALTTPAIFGPGRIFFRSAWGALRSRALHMDVPIALALAVGYGRGAYNTIQDSGPIYFDGVATLIFLLLVGRFLQQRAQRAATDSSELLFSLAPATARVVIDGRVEEVPSVAVLPGALLDVRTGDTLAADGTVVSGESTLDLALLTGESRPISARIGTEVFAGTTNLSAPIQVRVTSAGESSRLGRILKDVEDSARRRAPIVRLADRMASLFITMVLILATAAWWYGIRTDPAHALDNAIAMLIVSCPCALALATPLAVTVAIGRAARQGILIKGGDALEVLSRPGLLILDKTGTITEGRMALDEWIGPANVKPLIAALEKHSRHPVAAAFVRAWETDEMVTVTDVTETLGGGIRGKVNGHELAIGTPIWIAQSVREAAVSFAPLGAALTPAVVAVDGQIVGRAGFGDPLRPDAIAAIRELKSRGWKVSILSGDDPAVVTAAAHTLGLNAAECRGAATPEEKRAIVERAAKEGPVVMVGDGVNDAAAIAAATVGIGVRGGAEACLAAADVFLARSGLTPLLELERGARRTVGLIRLGIAFSIGYNILGAALAFTGRMDPLIAAIVMPLSSLTVVLAAWRGRTFTGANT
jgi:Cu2+-exporting ATPase